MASSVPTHPLSLHCAPYPASSACPSSHTSSFLCGTFAPPGKPLPQSSHSTSFLVVQGPLHVLRLFNLAILSLYYIILFKYFNFLHVLLADIFLVHRLPHMSLIVWFIDIFPKHNSVPGLKKYLVNSFVNLIS